MNICKSARLQSKLTLDDVRFLLNQKCWGTLSRVEAGKRFATKEIAIGYYLLFDIPFEELFKREIEQLAVFLEGYTQSRMDDIENKTKGTDRVERLLALRAIQQKVTN